MNKIIRLTENDIHSMIKECINSVLSEGYSGKYFEDQIDKQIPLVFNWMKGCDEGKYQPKKEGHFTVPSTISINLKPFNRNNGYMQQKFIKNSKINVTYHYLPERQIEGSVCGITNYRNQAKLSKITIDVFFNKNVTPEAMKEAMIHEITHATDFRIGDFRDSWLVGSGIKKYRHVNDLASQLPEYINKPLYYLWDTEEFQAWQSSMGIVGGIDKFVEMLMKYLEQANNDNNPETWEAFKKYMTINNKTRVLGMVFKQRDKKDFTNTPWQSAKHYFIKTSFNKLKKFIQKVR